MTTPLQPGSGLPSGYPFDYERQVTLPSGRTVCFRPVVPGDAAVLAREAALADADTLYNRFFNPAIRLTNERLRYLTEVDYHDRFALVAFIDGEAAAIGRFEPAGEGVAEVAIVVKPEWRRIGIATEMLEMLEVAALERGVTRLEAYYLPSNRAVEGVLDKRNFGKPTVESGVAEVIKSIG